MLEYDFLQNYTDPLQVILNSHFTMSEILNYTLNENQGTAL